MLRKLLLTTVLLAFFAPALALGGGGYVEDRPEQQMIQEPLRHKKEGMSDSVLAALIAGGLGLTGAVITAVVAINSRRKG